MRGAARLLSVIAGHDGMDSTSLDAPLPDLEAACGRDVKGVRIGIPAEYFAEGLDPAVAASVKDAVAALQKRGCIVREVKLPHTRYAVATYYVLCTAEASSNLYARFDGVRYGLARRSRSRSARHVWGHARRGVRRRGEAGASCSAPSSLSAGYYDAYYLRAQRVRTLVRRDFEAAFRDVDVVCSPTAPTPAFRLGEKIDDPLAMYLNDVYIAPPRASRNPRPPMSVPCRPTPAGLPVGLQIIARPLDEATMLAVGAACEADFPCASPS